MRGDALRDVPDLRLRDAANRCTSVLDREH